MRYLSVLAILMLLAGCASTGEPEVTDPELDGVAVSPAVSAVEPSTDEALEHETVPEPADTPQAVEDKPSEIGAEPADSPKQPEASVDVEEELEDAHDTEVTVPVAGLPSEDGSIADHETEPQTVDTLAEAQTEPEVAEDTVSVPDQAGDDDIPLAEAVVTEDEEPIVPEELTEAEKDARAAVADDDSVEVVQAVETDIAVEHEAPIEVAEDAVDELLSADRVAADTDRQAAADDAIALASTPLEDEPAPVVVFDSGSVPMAEPAADATTKPDPLPVHQPEVAVETIAEPVEPAPPPLPDPLNGRQINSLVFTTIGDGLMPVHRSGSALYLLHDLDDNGYNDVFALAVRGDRREIAEFANIHDYTRLYSTDRNAIRFYLRLFYQREGTLVPADLVSLGERLVVDSFEPQAVVQGSSVPFVVSTVFTTRQGRVREWVNFTGGKPTRFSMQERIGEIPRVEDIDGDGTVDVVMYEEDYEVGVGNETYMTWHRWNGDNFAQHATVNIVRNLQSFLAEAFDLITREDWTGFAARVLSEASRKTLPPETGDDLGVFERVFTLASAGEAFRNVEIGPTDDIRKAVYPDVRENPFSQRDATGFFFPLTVRFESAGGRNHLYTARVYMLTDPFGERQFAFGLAGE
jgi:hypothetical protein